MKKVLVTGGYGYVGSHTIERLCAAGHIVDSFDLNHSKNDISKYIRKNILKQSDRDMEEIDEQITEEGSDKEIVDTVDSIDNKPTKKPKI